MSGNNVSITEYSEKENTIIVSIDKLNTLNRKNVFYQIQTLLNRGYKNFILDFSKIAQLTADDLGGINYLVEETLPSEFHTIIIINSLTNKRLFKLLELDKRADIVETRHQAFQLLDIRRNHV